MAEGLNINKFCPNHPDTIIHCKGLCKNCYDKQLKNKDPEYRKRQLINSRKYAILHKDRIKTYAIKRRLLHSERDAFNKRVSTLKRKYNLTLEEYNILKDNSNNTCYICGRSPALGKVLHIDHNHITGKIRGLLCAQCNWYLGFIEKDNKILDKIKNYLEL
jgi:hypothetical protein